MVEALRLAADKVSGEITDTLNQPESDGRLSLSRKLAEHVASI